MKASSFSAKYFLFLELGYPDRCWLISNNFRSFLKHLFNFCNISIIFRTTSRSKSISHCPMLLKYMNSNPRRVCRKCCSSIRSHIVPFYSSDRLLLYYFSHILPFAAMIKAPQNIFVLADIGKRFLLPYSTSSSWLINKLRNLHRKRFYMPCTIGQGRATRKSVKNVTSSTKNWLSKITAEVNWRAR